MTKHSLNSRIFAAAVGVVALCSSSGAALANVIFSDSTFNLGTYSQAFNFEGDPANTAVFSQCASCGNPGTALQLQVDMPNGGGPTYNSNAMLTGVINSAFAYDPHTQGAISSISASIDKNFGINQDLLYNSTFRPIIEQDGVFYSGAISGPVLQGPGFTGYNTIAGSGLTAADFVNIDTSTGNFGSSHPDFAGDAMLFGIGQFLGAPAIDDTDFTFYFDNLNITLNTASVPEPFTLSIFGAGLAGAAALRRRKKAGTA
jgi:hypothetical protein